MLKIFEKRNYPELRTEKEEKKVQRKIYFQVLMEILIPIIIFIIAYFNSSWLQEYLYSDYPRGAGIKSILLLWVIVLPIWILITCIRLLIKRGLGKKDSVE
jgi:hypothetical protein